MNCFRFLLLFSLVFIPTSAVFAKSSLKQQGDRERYGKISKEKQDEKLKFMKSPLLKDRWDLERVKVKDAWLKFSTGSREIVVAIIDTGADIKHPALKGSIWKNPKEIPGNGKDDDKNGHIDDIHGWDFSKNSNKIYDTHGHGTHIAGIVKSVAPKVSLMILKYYNPNDNGKNNLNNTIKAIKYAVDNGAHIINYSGGGLEANAEEKKQIDRARKKGILFVAAAGNEKSNMDKHSYYPAGYGLNNIFAVGATHQDPSDKIIKSSNFSKSLVGLGTPGINIRSALPGGRYGFMTGTSQATALTSGAAVLIMSYYKNKQARFAIKQLKMTGDIRDSLVGKTSQRRRLNIYRALQAREYGLNFLDEKVKGSFVTLEQRDKKKGFEAELNSMSDTVIDLKKDSQNKNRLPARKKASVPEIQNKELDKSLSLKRWYFKKK